MYISNSVMFKFGVLVSVPRDDVRTAGASMLTSVTLAFSAIGYMDVSEIKSIHSGDNFSLFFFECFRLNCSFKDATNNPQKY